ncbi:MAG: FGGY family carbohydrate kinase [Bacteroidales bacterium]|nr:FGGY family carbohydrate kinase [Bacteroidales bacterium]MEE1081640.1 FGGY family carbohydrate kinase [Bacteroidales bacterium]
MYLLGYDIGTSSVKASLVDVTTGQSVASAQYPDAEAPITANQPGWAEQEPEMWWEELKQATKRVFAIADVKNEISAIGISYQMHGLVCVDKEGKPLRPSIIWCDGRAVPYGNAAFEAIGGEKCLSHLLNSPGNFTAAKLAWVKENEPELFAKIHKIMLPGDYIAMKLSGGVMNTTVSGLSEGMFWDFKNNEVSKDVMNYFGFPQDIIADIVPTFAVQSKVCAAVAAELGLPEGCPIAYRGGDQPNNALSLNVMKPGEIAATGGTSGVVYGVLGEVNYDPKSRVNTFAHVNHNQPDTRLGVLLCINGTGILNAWMKRTVAPEGISYPAMNDLAETAPVGAEGLSIIPFGNGAERVLQNQNPGASVHGINFNIHTKAHMLRAAQEGIAFSFAYGMEIMKGMGMDIKTIKAGHANLFLSPLFRRTLANVTDATIELYETDGSVGAAKGAGIGAGIYKDSDEAFATLKHFGTEKPEADTAAYKEAYKRWKAALEK